MNITDVWHLTDDGDQWEDKMEKGARRDNKTVWQVARMYEENFKKYAYELGIDIDDIAFTRATEYIPEQITMVKSLTQKWYTYVIQWDGVYMDTSKVADYGKLAQLDFEGMNSEHRWDGAKIDSSKKKNLSDFALWKFSPEGEQRSMEWVYDGDASGYMIVADDFDQQKFINESDFDIDKLEYILRSELSEEEKATLWFPGRHIECSAMADAVLWDDAHGRSIDIHTWWVDHISVHHTNEITQAECSLWCTKRVNRWMHGQFLQIDGGKVSKSKGDDLSVAGIIAKWYTAQDLRYFYFTAHYRSFLDFTWEAMDAAKSTRNNIIKKLISYIPQWADISMNWEINQALYDNIVIYLANDLDINQAITEIQRQLLWSSATSIFSELNEIDILPNIRSIFRIDDEILKLWLKKWVEDHFKNLSIEAPQEIQDLAQQRLDAKHNKDYDLADTLRQQIAGAWWEVKDTTDWFELTIQ